MTMTLSALQLQASKLLQTGLALVSSVILARALGPSGLGAYAVLIAFAVLLQGLTSLGFEDLVLARGPLYGSDTPKARSLYRRLLRIRGVVMTGLCLSAVAAASGVLPDPFPATTRLAFGCAVAYASFNSVATLGGAVQAARLRPANSAALDALWALGVTATYSLLLLTDRLTLGSALLATAFWQAAIAVGYAYLLVPIALRSDTSEGIAAFRVRETAMFWANGLLSIGVGKNSDVLAMKVVGASVAAVGRYSAAYNANLTAATVLVQGAGTMLYVGLGRVFATGSRQNLADAWQRTITLSALLSVPVLVYCIIFPRSVLLLIYGNAFTAGASALVALATTSVLVRALGGGSNQSLLFLANCQSQVLIVRAVCVIVNIALDVVLYPVLGILGVALASGGSGVAIIALEFSLGRRIAPIRIPWSSMLRIVLPYAAAGLLGRWLVGDANTKLVLLGNLCAVFAVGTLLLTFTRPLHASDVPDNAPLVIKRILGLVAVPRRTTAPY